MLKLLNVDAAGERALRIVSYFDQLALHHPDLEAVVRSTALLADCTAGLELPDDLGGHRFTPDGVAVATSLPDATSTAVEVTLNDRSETAGRAWLERPGGPGDLDDFILERMAITVASVVERRTSPRDLDYAAGFADPALAQLFVNERASETDRSRAARLLGLEHSSQVQLVAMQVDPEVPDDLERVSEPLRVSWRRKVFVARMSRDVGILIVATREPVDWSGVELQRRACSGPVVEAADAPQSWREARDGLRFAGLGAAWPSMLPSESVGSLRLFVSLDPETVRRHPDFQKLTKMHSQTGGDESIMILDFFLHAESLRSAARDARFHHSSVQNRLTRIERELGFDLKTGTGRQRASSALLLWQLFDGPRA
ncbi:hypothetical protein AX769_00975 [Frondihabitans sp. PAMC 28766]|uniref:helix-turn-helix domain-containing protein n=1 Tax=Frondihabitans sp. PAMC 28766 TaxID=1795630 RepID=UPI00078CA204|nr:helix-turn-helix domain-containing protein [Frondihabitans sp. PAMC 28766]AMM18970.1 hypothetical protein AX769_00975 [Frondihabitans sp. PAMC 28766]